MKLKIISLSYFFGILLFGTSLLAQDAQRYKIYLGKVDLLEILNLPENIMPQVQDFITQSFGEKFYHVFMKAEGPNGEYFYNFGPCFQRLSSSQELNEEQKAGLAKILTGQSVPSALTSEVHYGEMVEVFAGNKDDFCEKHRLIVKSFRQSCSEKDYNLFGQNGGGNCSTETKRAFEAAFPGKEYPFANVNSQESLERLYCIAIDLNEGVVRGIFAISTWSDPNKTVDEKVGEGVTVASAILNLTPSQQQGFDSLVQNITSAFRQGPPNPQEVTQGVAMLQGFLGGFGRK